MINTSDCWLSSDGFKKEGHITSESGTASCNSFYWGICTLEFSYSVMFLASAMVEIIGKNALKIVSLQGNITIDSKFDASGKALANSYETFLGGYHNYNNVKDRGNCTAFSYYKRFVKRLSIIYAGL